MCTTLTDMFHGEIHTSTITFYAHNDSRPCSTRNGQALREIIQRMSVSQLDAVQGLNGNKGRLGPPGCSLGRSDNGDETGHQNNKHIVVNALARKSF